MKPFHSELGAVSWIEQNANGKMLSVLVVAPARKAGKTILYTFKSSYVNVEGAGWILRECK